MTKSFLVLVVLLQFVVSCASYQQDRVPSSEDTANARRFHGGGARGR